ncbi:KH domain-containing protein [Ditylenchus destructor]|uniref:KH domain-containing protein n=1 Tax=Ditylenchus destructor TaxID=166010 RepID=A0AAD4N6B1_9BILA|nr:KH domain-containing protein [Ditylenchus destructor]
MASKDGECLSSFSVPRLPQIFGELDSRYFFIPQEMKRQNQDDRPQGGNKRYRADPYNDALAEGKFELRMLIPTKAAGAVIGKGGEYIKSLREKYDATLTVPDRSTPERVLTILCRQDDVKSCFTDVLNKLAEEQKGAQVEIRMLVHQSHAGAIIGRAGSKIKELREQTGANIKVFQECCPQSTDRVVLFTSSQDKLPDAIGTIIEFIKEIPVKGMQKPYDATNYDPRMAFGYGGFEMDKRFGGPMGGGPPPRGGRGGPPPPSYDHYSRGPPGGGYGGGGGGSGGYGRGGMPPMGGGGMGPGGYMGDTGVVSTQVTIPNELGGTIIGKGGERINRIRSDSGAKIDVGSATGNEERIITITGTQYQIQQAQYLLQQSVRTSEAGRRYLQEQR